MQGYIGRTKQKPNPRIENFHKIKKEISYIASKIIEYDFTLQELAKCHEEYNWDWSKFKKHISQGSPEEDWILYSSMFYYELSKKIVSKGFYNSPPEFLKEYSAIMGNWIFNNHLLYYGKVYNRVDIPMILYYAYIEKLIKVIHGTYYLLRLSGCSIQTQDEFSIIENFPFKMPYNFQYTESKPNDFLKIWNKKFKFVDISTCDKGDLINLIASRGSEFFITRFPVVLTTLWHRNVLTPSETILEFDIEE